MSDYLTFTLWRQREERMPHELERQRVVQERLSEQQRDHELQLTVSPEPDVADATALAEQTSEPEPVLITH